MAKFFDNRYFLKFYLCILWLMTTCIAISQNSPEFRTSNRLILGEPNERSASLGIGDIDQDGDLDVVIANGRHWPEQNQIFFNNGRGIFTVSVPLDVIRETSYATELADFDGDGDLDIAVGNDMAPNAIYLNAGDGTFSRSGTFGKPYAPTRNLTVADVDGDGDVDILITNRGSENEICLNDGFGHFSESLPFGEMDD